MTRARSVAEVIAGEAASGTPEERIADMRAIASVIANRAALLGVSPEQVIANSNEFNAYNRPLPPGVGDDIVALAQEQIDYVAENGPVNNATFYATPAAVDNLPNGLSYETATTGHQYFSDPQMRSIGTSEGYVRPNQYAYAQGLDVASIPTPYGPAEPTNNSLMAAYSATPTYRDDPFSSVLGGSAPAQNQWSAMASAQPVSSPMGSVTASGLLGPASGLEASATATGLLGSPISQADVDRAFFNATGAGQMDPSFTAGLMSPQNPVVPTAVETQTFTPGTQTASAPAAISQADVDRAFFNATGAGLLDPSFTAGLMGPSNPVVPTSVQSVSYTQGQEPSAEFASAPAEKTSRIGNMPNLADAARMNPLAGAVNPATNVTSFMDQPADIGGFLGAMAAQRGPMTGINSAEHQTIVANAMRQQFNPTVQAPVSAYAAEQVATPAEQAIAQQMSVPSTGLLGASPDLSASATVPSIAGTMTPAQIAGYQQMAASAPNITNLSGFTGIFDDGTAYQNAVPTAAQVPDLQQKEVVDQPSVATVDGPATTPAVEQQAQQDQNIAPTTTNSVTQTEQAPSRTTLGSRLAKAVNPGTIGGGLLGGLAAGPVGGLLGGLLGNGLYNGSTSGLLSSQPMTINNIGGGLMNTASIWGGGTPAGTQATASDGQTITSMGNGYTAVQGKSGVVTMFDQNGKAMSYFGGALGNNDPEAQTSNSGGGFFGGLFG